jgi:hypothetical protein
VCSPCQFYPTPAAPVPNAPPAPEVKKKFYPCIEMVSRAQMMPVADVDAAATECNSLQSKECFDAIGMIQCNTALDGTWYNPLYHDDALGIGYGKYFRQICYEELSPGKWGYPSQASGFYWGNTFYQCESCDDSNFDPNDCNACVTWYGIETSRLYVVHRNFEKTTMNFFTWWEEWSKSRMFYPRALHGRWQVSMVYRTRHQYGGTMATTLADF